jgi:hypothetical protein
MEVIPVPMLTANQEGVKLRIRRRHSREMEEWRVWVCVDGAEGGGEDEEEVDGGGGFMVDIVRSRSMGG